MIKSQKLEKIKRFENTLRLNGVDEQSIKAFRHAAIKRNCRARDFKFSLAQLSVNEATYCITSGSEFICKVKIKE